MRLDLNRSRGAPTFPASSLRLADCPQPLARALRALDAGDGTIDVHAVEAAICTGTGERLRWQRLLTVGSLVACAMLLAERSAVSAPVPLDILSSTPSVLDGHEGWRRALQQQGCTCPSPPAAAPPGPPPSQGPAASATNSSGGGASSSSSSQAGNSGAASNLEPSPAPDVEPSPVADEGDGDGAEEAQQETEPPSAAGDDVSSLKLELPEMFAYVWVVGGSLCVCCSVILFIHRANALTAIPCLKCLRT